MSGRSIFDKQGAIAGAAVDAKGALYAVSVDTDNSTARFVHLLRC